MKKKRDAFPSPDDRTKKDFGGWTLPGALAPISTNDSYKRSHHPFTPQLLSPWQRFTAWLRYYSVQMRWDIERWLARKLHRRWF